MPGSFKAVRSKESPAEQNDINDKNITRYSTKSKSPKIVCQRSENDDGHPMNSNQPFQLKIYRKIMVSAEHRKTT
jgi:hypothetical protein